MPTTVMSRSHSVSSGKFSSSQPAAKRASRRWLRSACEHGMSPVRPHSASNRKRWRSSARKRLTMASASFSWSRSSVLRSDGRTELPAGSPAARWRSWCAQLQAHQEVQCLDQVAARSASTRSQLDEPAQPLAPCRARARRAAGQRAHAVHDREGAELLQVQRLLVAARRQARPPGCAVRRTGRPRRRSAPGRRRCRPGCGRGARARSCSSAASPATGGGVEEDRQVHRAVWRLRLP